MFCIENNEKNKSTVITGASSKKQKESSLILRKAKFQAIFKFVLSSASGGAGGGKYNRISAFVSMPVLLIRRSLEKFFKKNFRDDRFCFGFAKVLALAFIFTLATTSESSAETWDCSELMLLKVQNSGFAILSQETLTNRLFFVPGLA